MKEYTLNIQQGKLWNVAGKAALSADQKPKIPYQEGDGFIVNMVDGAGVAVDITDYVTWEFAGDNNFLHNDSLMLFSDSVGTADVPQITVLDAATGRLQVNYNANNAKYNTVTGSLSNFSGSAFFAELKGFASGDADGTSLMRETFYACPTVKTVEGAPTAGDPEYLTDAQIVALLAGKANQISIFGAGPILTDSGGQQWRLVAETSGALSLEPVTT